MKISEAESAIQKILKEFEIESGLLVESVEINDIDITGISDTRQQIARKVIINTKQVPGHNWPTE